MISKILLQFTQITLDRGTKIDSEDQNCLFMMSQGEALVRIFPKTSPKDDQGQHCLDGERDIKKICPGELIGNMFGLLHFALFESIQPSFEREYEIQLQMTF